MNARPYVESFCVYGDRRGFEWEQGRDGGHRLFTMAPYEPGMWGRPVRTEVAEIPYRPDLLPPELAPFAEGGHGGSHPHLVHEFVRSVVEGRPPRVDAVTAADWTAPGICAHLSALRDGEPVAVALVLDALRNPFWKPPPLQRGRGGWGAVASSEKPSTPPLPLPRGRAMIR